MSCGYRHARAKTTGAELKGLELRAATMEKVVAIYRDTEGLRGDERDALITAGLQKLESADSTVST